MDEKREPPPEAVQPARGEQADSLSPLSSEAAEDEEASRADRTVERDSVGAEEDLPERESVDDDGDPGSDRGNRSEEAVSPPPAPSRRQAARALTPRRTFLLHPGGGKPGVAGERRGVDIARRRTRRGPRRLHPPKRRTGRTMRILVVEDEARLASAVERYLRENAFAVDVAGAGKDALFLANVNPYDAIVLDIGIPEPDGFEVLRRLRERGNAARVLILTARDGVEDRIHGLELGADDYLVKPFALGELRARLRALLRRGDSLAPDVLRVADLELDSRGQTAVRAGTPIALTTKEYALLEYLVRNTGRVVGRAEISDKVWDERYDPASNLIEVYINRLRRKVDGDGAAPLIHTRRGAGYVLAETEGDADPA